MQAFQDYYPENVAHCYGCGRLNEHGHQIKTYWEGDETVTRFLPRPEHTAIPGFVYGGLLASLIDCHSIAAASTANGGSYDGPVERFVTASLKVDYVRPTPLGPELTLRARTEAFSARKVQVVSELLAEGSVRVRGEVLAVRMPETMTGAVMP